MATAARTPPSDAGAGWVAFVLALTLLMAPAFGVPTEEMLQDTAKSLIVSVGALVAAMLWIWQHRQRTTELRLHAVLVFPLVLMLYALGSMAWSHTYLAGVEAVRWFVFSVLLVTGLQVLDRDLVPKLAFGAHVGATIACLWGLAQFWFDFSLFPQGPNPASTFVNRNFAAEFVVTVWPFSVFLLLRARTWPALLGHALALGFNTVFVLASGTRSALVTLLVLAALVPVALWRFRERWAAWGWSRDQVYAVGSVLVATVLLLGVAPTGNPKIVAEHEASAMGLTPIARAQARLLSVTEKSEYTERSFSMRLTMWKATTRMIAAHPLAGVGAGAWEVQSPRYQDPGSQLETDFYVHNEPLQLLAEYGLTGALALAGLLVWLCAAGWRTWRDRRPEALDEGPLRSAALLSLLALLLVSNAGFPWRLAATGAMFALALAVVAASDQRLDPASRWGRSVPWPAVASRITLGLAVLALGLTLWIGWQAARAEHLLVRAVKLALTVSDSGKPEDPSWDPVKREVVALLREGTAINPHYRKVTPMAADELAHWGDWKNALWVYESVAASRPYVPALLLNIARGHAQQGDFDQAEAALARCRELQPGDKGIASVELTVLSGRGRTADALAMARERLSGDGADTDFANAAYALGVRQRDWELAIQAMRRRIDLTPDRPRRVVESWLYIGRIEGVERHRDEAAMDAFRAALAAAPEGEETLVLGLVPPPYQAKLQSLRPSTVPSGR